MPPTLKKAQKAVAAGISIPHTQPAASQFTPQADALLNAGDEFRAQAQYSTLYAKLATSTPTVRASDEREVVLRSAEALPFQYAHEAFCALVKAGEVRGALQLSAFWHYEQRRQPERACRRVHRQLVRTIGALEEFRDAATLNALLDIFSDALKEQNHTQKALLDAVALAPRNGAPRFVQHKLFEPLGPARISSLLVRAAEAVCRVGDKEGMSALEKLIILDKCAESASAALGAAHLPYRLCRLLDNWIAQGTVSSKMTGQVCPNLPARLVHPSHYSTLDILSLSMPEARYVRKQWVAQLDFAANGKQSGSAPPSWGDLIRRCLSKSKTLQEVEAKQLLVSLMCTPGKAVAASHERAFHRARHAVVELLRSSQPGVRRKAAATLLNNRHLLVQLRISPVRVASVYLQSFHSVGSLDPAVGRLCRALVTRHSRAGQYEDAARLLWNHLSVDSPASTAFFRSSTAALDQAVVATSRTMHNLAKQSRGQRWMGRRSLALLRVAAAASPHITVTHCVPVCAGALECGAPFASVNEALCDVFANDREQKKWALNLVRLCSQTEAAPRKIAVIRHGLSAIMSQRFAKLCSAQGSRRGEVVLPSPTRSRQLALWTAWAEEKQLNPRLSALMTAAFLDRDVRECILNCSWHEPAGPRTTLKAAPTPTENQSILDTWTWEVAAGVASNCTREDTLKSFLECLKRRRPQVVSDAGEHMDRVSALLCSEMEMQDSEPFVGRANAGGEEYNTLFKKVSP